VSLVLLVLLAAGAIVVMIVARYLLEAGLRHG
jgi:hypothetical protein